jgi:hypothetical protein
MTMKLKTDGTSRPQLMPAIALSVAPTMFSYNINAAVRTLNLALYGNLHVYHSKNHSTLKMVVVGFSKRWLISTRLKVVASKKKFFSVTSQ